MGPSHDADEASRERSRRWPEWLPRVLVESALIVFSVLFALALDEWRQDRSERARAVLALAGIASEVAANRDAAERARTFHRELHDTLRALAEADQPPSIEIYYYRGMFSPARVVSTAWESARTTAVLDRLPYDLVLALSRAYENQAKYEELGDRIAADLMADLRVRGAEAVLRDGYRGFVVLTEDFSNRERRLIAGYEDVLARLETASVGSVDRGASEQSGTDD